MTDTKKATHEIVIELQKLADDSLVAVPKIPPYMFVGETVSYSSPAGNFRVEFPDGSLFIYDPVPATVADSNVRTLVKDGVYDSRCFVTPAGGQEVGWSSQNPQSGGVHDVKK